jgi:hypothetical protein
MKVGDRFCFTCGRVNDHAPYCRKPEGEVISVYADAQAVEDGILVPLNSHDRVTSHLWEWLKETTPMEAQPPHCWPVDMMLWFKAKDVPREAALELLAKHGEEGQHQLDEIVRSRRAAALALGILGEYSRRATEVYERNLDGGIFGLYARLNDGTLHGLAAQKTLGEEDCRLLMVPNDAGGITLMFPEDY